MATTRPFSFVALLLAITVILAPWGSAGAQASETIVVVPVTSADGHREVAMRLAQDVVMALKNSGATVVPLDSTSSLFSERHSRDPAPVSEQDYDRLQREAELVSRSMQEDKPSEASRHLKEVERLAERVGETVNRDIRTKESIFRACVAGVRQAKRAGQLAEANRIAVWCLTTVQDEDITGGRQPADVRDIFVQAQRAIELGSTAPLTISSTKDGTVILNTSRLGPSPYTLEHPAARAYRVQVDKDGIPGRVHMITPGPKPTSVFVDLEFDRSVVTTDPTLRLNYARVDEPVVRAHALTIAQVFKADSAILVGANSAERLFIRRVAEAGGRAATVQAPYDDSSLNSAIAELFAQPEAPVARATSEPAPATPIATSAAKASRPLPDNVKAAPRQARWPLRLGLPLAAAGIATMSTGYWRLRERALDGETFRHTPISDPHYLPRGDAWLNARPESFILVSTGVALASAGIALVSLPLPPRRYIWLPISTAAAGLGLAAVGLVTFSKGSQCDGASAAGGNLQNCVQSETSMDRGSIMALSAIPLFTMPAVQLVRWFRLGARPTLQASVGTVVLRLDGEF